jgi:hypothetical protein
VVGQALLASWQCKAQAIAVLIVLLYRLETLNAQRDE